MRVLLPSLLTLALVVGGILAIRETEPPEERVTHRPIQLREDGYSSSQACKACHPSQYSAWHSSYHRTMTQVATPEAVVADFDGVQVNDVHGAPMRLERTGRDFWAEFDDPDSASDTAPRPRVRRQVVMMTGSHHQQVYWYATGSSRLLGQLPGVYLLAEQRWIPRRMAVLHPPSDPVFSETGHWNSTCIACHATHGKPAFDTPYGSQPIASQTVDTTTVELGVACEACHGPSANHARANRAPQRRYWLHLTGAPDPTTVLPTRLNPRVSSQVCGQCHGIWEFYDVDGERHANSAGLPYRPGDDLARTRFVAQPTRNLESPTMKALLAEDQGFIADSFWPDGMVRVSGREYNGVIESPCFKSASDDKRTLSCFSCHTMHRTAGDRRSLEEWADDQIAPGMEGNDACLQCHPSFKANLAAHTTHAPASSGSSCYNCHMPYTTYGLLKTIRSHTISSPSAAETIETGRPNACNLCHLDKTLGWTAEQLEKSYGVPRPAMTGDEESVAASLLWLLRGDAGQRAIVAQAMAWKPAQEASGVDWTVPYLTQLLDDPYDAVRFIASRALRTLPAFGSFQYDFVAGPRARREAQLRAMAAWDRSRGAAGRRAAAELLLDVNGDVKIDAVQRLLGERNSRRVLLRE